MPKEFILEEGEPCVGLEILRVVLFIFLYLNIGGGGGGVHTGSTPGLLYLHRVIVRMEKLVE
jgi:hypothetical protein